MGKNDKHIFQVIEMSSKKIEKYAMIATDKEMSNFLKAKREAYGYIKGLGGDRTYEAIAYYM